MYRQHRLGIKAEKLAHQYLRRHGLTLITRNYRCRHGEIDLIMHDDQTTVFVEVRRRTHHQFGSGSESVHTGKQRRLILTAKHWLSLHDPNRHCRFDIISVDQGWDITWIRHAFEIDYAIN